MEMLHFSLNYTTCVYAIVLYTMYILDITTRTNDRRRSPTGRAALGYGRAPFRGSVICILFVPRNATLKFRERKDTRLLLTVHCLCIGSDR